MSESHNYESAGPRCPYCDWLHSPDEPFYWDEDTSEMECERCDKEFDLQVHTTTCWTSHRKESIR